MGCSSHLYRYTYPTDFTYIETKDVKTDMQKLAVLVSNLNRSLKTDNVSTSQTQLEIIETLKEMEKIGSSLKSSGATNHPLIDKNIDTFRNSLEYARMSAQRSPPNYYLAGTITGNCASCHSIAP